jgi:hypothetical protein
LTEKGVAFLDEVARFKPLVRTRPPALAQHDLSKRAILSQ